jgi:hypothetical protein
MAWYTLSDLSRPFSEPLARYVAFAHEIKARITPNLTLCVVRVASDRAVGWARRGSARIRTWGESHALLRDPVSRSSTHNSIDGSRIVATQIRARRIRNRRKLHGIRVGR